MAEELQRLVKGNVLTDATAAEDFEKAYASDIAAAVRYCREKGLQLAVKGGGHSWRSLFIASDGVTIDMSTMKAVSVSQSARTVTMQGGATMIDVLAKSRQFDLAPSWGSCIHTGLGAPLMGSMNLLARSDGIGADTIICAQILLADGSLVTASKDVNADLLAMIRGGGPTLGIITELTMRLADVSNYHGVSISARDPDFQQLRTLVNDTHKLMHIQPAVGIEIAQIQTDAGKSILVLAGLPGKASQSDVDAFLNFFTQVADVTEASIGNASFFDVLNSVTMINDAIPYSSVYQAVFHLTYEQATDELLQLIDRVVYDNLPKDVAPFSVWDVMGSTKATNAFQSTHSLTPFASKVDLQIWIALAWPPGQNNEANTQYGEKMKELIAPHVTSTNAYANHATFLTDEYLTSQVGGARNLEALRATKARLDPGNVFNRHPLVGL